ncbi:MAG: HDOD domain-containing protein [Candidatus Sumerlaeia bacterium]
MEKQRSLIDQIKDDVQAGNIALPMLEKLVSELNSKLNDEKAGASDIAALIEKDPALATRVLNMANSAAYSGLVKMRSVERAIVRVGLKPIKSFFVTSAMKNVFTGKTSLLKNIFNIWWKHSLCCALGCRKIATIVGKSSIAEDAYMLGLLHDIGTIVILNKLNEMYADGESVEIHEDLIIELVDSFHAQLGAIILNHLEFDEELCQIVETHHTPELYNDQENTLFQILQVENNILIKAGVAVHPNPNIAITSLPSFEKLGLNPIFVAEEEVDAEDQFETMNSALS